MAGVTCLPSHADLKQAVAADGNITLLLLFSQSPDGCYSILAAAGKDAVMYRAKPAASSHLTTAMWHSLGTARDASYMQPTGVCARANRAYDLQTSNHRMIYSGLKQCWLLSKFQRMGPSKLLDQPSQLGCCHVCTQCQTQWQAQSHIWDCSCQSPVGQSLLAKHTTAC